MGSDKQEGPGWWIADDGRWYPPELHPNYQSLVDQTRQQSAVADMYAVPPGSTGGDLFNPGRQWFSPYAMLSLVASAAAIWMLFRFGLRGAFIFFVAQLVLVICAFRWTRSGNGGRLMARLSLAAFIVSIVVPVAVVGRAVFDIATTPSMWDLDSGECLRYEFSGPQDDSGEQDYDDFDVVDCAEEHHDEVFAVADMEVGQPERSAATSTQNPSLYWDDLADETCAAHLDDPAIQSAPDDMGYGFTRWPFEDVHNFPKTAEGYGTVVCTLGPIDGGVKRGSILGGS